jgi:EAL and modified HD-GYP domain-containing signal transduction protein
MNHLIVRRQPVVNRQRAITATRLIVCADSSATAAAALNGLGDIWPQTRTVLVSLGGISPDIDLMNWQVPDNAMLEIPAAALGEPQTKTLIEELSRKDVPLCVDDYTAQTQLPAAARFRFLLADVQRLPMCHSAPGLTLAKNTMDNAGFDTATINGYSGATGWFFLHGIKPTGKLNPSHAQLIHLLNLVRKNAEVRDIENALKRDVTLSFKLLRYINSVGFGLSCEIQSFRHAVSILGFDKLHKWLSLLLVTASKDPAAPALMQTAIARGRFMEIVGATFFDREQTDNLFITGAFSLLDLLLGAGIEQALEQMHLPDAIGDALIRHEGIYAPFLDLARACESAGDEELLAKAEALQLTAERLNRAQLDALSFADSVQLG